MKHELTLAAKLYADASRMMSGLEQGERGVRKFSHTVKNEFNAIKGDLNSFEGKLAGVGITIGATAAVIKSAQLDKSITQIGQTAGASRSEVTGLRSELFRMAEDTGRNLDDLKEGFDNAVQAGLNFDEALPVLDATNIAMAVTNAQAGVLTSSLTVASTAFNFDLSNPNMALSILDKMTVAGRKGNAELENLSSIFGRVGPNAASAGFGFSQTLAFVEGLSQIERQPERLATLADSTLRLFTNMNYMKAAQKGTGVKFFDADGTRRDAFDVIGEIKKQYDKLNTDAQRAVYIQKAFGKADLDTIKGMRVLLSGDMLSTIKGFTKEIDNAGGTLKNDLKEAIDNSVDQVGRLRGTLRQAADDFAQPINKAITNATKYALDKKSDGGLEMSGNDLLLAGGGAALATILTARYGGKLLSGVANKLTGIGGGVATGKVLEEAAGVTPVYVVNMGDGGMGGLPVKAAGNAKDIAKTTAAAGLGAAPVVIGGVAIAAGTGYGAGMLLNKGINASDNNLGTNIGAGIGRTVAMFLAPFSEDARMALTQDIKAKAAELTGTLSIKIDQDGRASATMSSNQSGINFIMANGPHMLAL